MRNHANKLPSGHRRLLEKCKPGTVDLFYLNSDCFDYQGLITSLHSDRLLILNPIV